MYVLASVFCLLFKKYYLNENIDFLQGIKAILDYWGAPYSWYIKMYIGLFIIIPFLNIIYNNLKSQKEKIILVLSFVGVCSIHTAINEEIKILPDFWSGLYPIMYYFIGAYLSEFGIKIKKYYLFVLLLVCLCLFSVYNFYKCGGEKFKDGIYIGWSGMENVIMSSIVFSLINSIRFKKCPYIIKKFFAKLSTLVLGAYLVSFIFDKYFYNILNTNVDNFFDRFHYFPIMVLLIFSCSLLLSFFIDCIIKVFKSILWKY